MASVASSGALSANNAAMNAFQAVQSPWANDGPNNCGSSKKRSSEIGFETGFFTSALPKRIVHTHDPQLRLRPCLVA
jgi:hypothetical protein